jgi:hypothetical protein
VGNLILLAAIGLPAYVLLAAVKPVHGCRRCKGGRVARRGRCPRCKGTGKTVRPGAVLVHRMLNDHVYPVVRDRIKTYLEERRQQ